MNEMTTAGPQDTAAGQAMLRQDLVARARALVPLLRAEAAACEAQRRLTGTVIAAMEDAGLFALRAPAVFGGHEADCRTYMEVVTELGRGDGSTAWVTFISTASAWVLSRFSEEAQREVFADGPGTRFIGLLAPAATAVPKDGGLVVNGRWGFSSGCLHAHWALLTVPRPEGPAGILIPMAEVAIEDTWYMAGCRATGSNTVVASDVFVPAHRILPIPGLLTGNALGPAHLTPVYREAFSANAIIMLVAPILGMAEAAFDVTLERVNAGNKRISYSDYADLRKSPAMQVRLAEARSLIDMARTSMMTWADRIAEAARTGVKIAYIDRIRLRVDIGTAMQLCRDAVDRLLSIQGASAFADTNPLQRIWRDLETGTRHGLLSPEVPIEIAARAFFGEETTISEMV